MKKEAQTAGETAHTPGPWTAEPDTNGQNRRRYILSPRADIIGTVTTINGFEKECAANARLIAAAPDLLAALDDLLLWADIPDDGSRVAVILRNNGRAAIAKATGKEAA